MLFSLNSLKQITIKQLSKLGFIVILCYVIWNRYSKIDVPSLKIDVPYVATTEKFYITNTTQLEDFSKEDWKYKEFYRFGTFAKKIMAKKIIPTDEIISNFGYKKEDVEDARPVNDGFIIVLKTKGNY